MNIRLWSINQVAPKRGMSGNQKSLFDLYDPFPTPSPTPHHKGQDWALFLDSELWVFVFIFNLSSRSELAQGNMLMVQLNCKLKLPPGHFTTQATGNPKREVWVSVVVSKYGLEISDASSLQKAKLNLLFRLGCKSKWLASNQQISL